MHSWGKYELAEHFVREKFTEVYCEAIIPVRKMGEIFLMGIDSKPGMV